MGAAQLVPGVDQTRRGEVTCPAEQPGSQHILRHAQRLQHLVIAGSTNPCGWELPDAPCCQDRERTSPSPFFRGRFWTVP